MAATDAIEIRESTQLIDLGAARWYVGVLRSKGRIVWECEHHHPNRTWGGRYGGESALTCATTELRRRLASGDAIHENVRDRQRAVRARVEGWEQDDELPF